jgi:predicted dehydrogenase
MYHEVHGPRAISHLPSVRAAASAGRHVLVEKAIAHTVVAADELIEACRLAA